MSVTHSYIQPEYVDLIALARAGIPSDAAASGQVSMDDLNNAKHKSSIVVPVAAQPVVFSKMGDGNWKSDSSDKKFASEDFQDHVDSGDVILKPHQNLFDSGLIGSDGAEADLTGAGVNSVDELDSAPSGSCMGAENGTEYEKGTDGNWSSGNNSYNSGMFKSAIAHSALKYTKIGKASESATPAEEEVPSGE